MFWGHLSNHPNIVDRNLHSKDDKLIRHYMSYQQPVTIPYLLRKRTLAYKLSVGGLLNNTQYPFLINCVDNRKLLRPISIHL